MPPERRKGHGEGREDERMVAESIILQVPGVCGRPLGGDSRHDEWEPDVRPDLYILAVGAFADPDFPPPSASIFEETKHTWTRFPDGMKHFQGTMLASS